MMVSSMSKEPNITHPMVSNIYGLLGELKNGDGGESPHHKDLETFRNIDKNVSTMLVFRMTV